VFYYLIQGGVRRSRKSKTYPCPITSLRQGKPAWGRVGQGWLCRAGKG